jgi:hypothetical protein
MYNGPDFLLLFLGLGLTEQGKIDREKGKGKRARELNHIGKSVNRGSIQSMSGLIPLGD